MSLLLISRVADVRWKDHKQDQDQEQEHSLRGQLH
jgi:hypothetical protein